MEIEGNVTSPPSFVRWVVIFIPHPEGSLEGGVNAEEHGTLRLLENAVVFASGER